jgi:hypothetical protein
MKRVVNISIKEIREIGSNGVDVPVKDPCDIKLVNGSWNITIKMKC